LPLGRQWPPVKYVLKIHSAPLAAWPPASGLAGMTGNRFVSTNGITATGEQLQ